MNSKNLYALALIAIILLSAVYILSRVIYTNDQDANVSTVGDTTVSAISIEPIAGIATVFSADSRVITWSTNAYPSNTGVNINLIRKVSNSPISYELVRAITSNTSNDGEYTWNPNSNELNSGLFIEVTCAKTSSACTSLGQPIFIQ